MFSESSTFSKTIFNFLVWFPAILLSDQGAHYRRRWNYRRSNEKIQDFSLKMYCSQNVLTLPAIYCYSITFFKRISFWCNYGNFCQGIIFFFYNAKNIALFTSIVAFSISSEGSFLHHVCRVLYIYTFN